MFTILPLLIFSDNVVSNLGTGGVTWATDTIASVEYPRQKTTWGPDGTANDVDVASGKPLPIQQRTSTGTEVPVVDNAGFTDGTTPVIPSGFVFDETAGTALAENDAAAARIDSKRAQVTVIEDTTTRGQRATVTAGNALKVDNSAVTQPISASSLPLPTGSSTLSEQQTQTTALQLIDDTVHSINAALGKANAIAGHLDDTTPTAATEDNVAPVRITAQRAIHTNLRNNSGTEIGTSGTPIRTDPTGSTTQPVSGTVTANAGTGTLAVSGPLTDTQLRATAVPISGTVTANAGTGTLTVDSELPPAAVLADTTSNPTTPIVASALEIFNGTTWDRARGDITNGLDVDVTRLPALVSGTANIGDVDVLTIAAGDNNIGNVDIVTMPNVTLATGTNTNEVVGDAASGSAKSGNPVQVGGVFNTTQPTVTTGQVVELQSTARGAVIVATGVDALVANATLSAETTKVIGTVNIAAAQTVATVTNLAQMSGVAISLNTGVRDTGTQRVTIATNDVVPVTDNAGSLTVDAPVGTPVNAQISDGTRTATVRDTGTSDSLNVAIVDAAGAQITSFGGGTEYTVNAVAPADPVGATFTMERDDQLAALTEIEGDWTNPRSSSKGALWVTIPDVNGDPITSFGGGTQYAEDTIHVTGDTMTLAGVVQQSADTALSGDGDRSLLQVDANGFLKVNIKAGAGSGGTAMTDDAAFTPAVTSITPMGAMFDDVTPDSVNEGDAGIVRMSANRNLFISIRDAGGNERGANITAGNALTVDGSATTQPISGTVTANAGSGTFTVDSELPTAGVLADATVNPTTPIVASAIEIFNGTTWDRARGDITNGLDVDVTRLPALVAGTANIGDVDVLTLPAIPAGTNNIGDVDILTIAAGDNNIGNVDIVTIPNVTLAAGTNTNEIVGDAASGAAKSGNPVQVGGVFNTTQPTVTTGQVVEAQSTARGALIVASGVDAIATNATLSAETTKVIGTINIAAAQTVATVTNVQQQAGVNISLNTGVRDAGTQRVTIATNDVVPVTDNSGSLTVDNPTATNLKAEVVGPTADNAANPTAKLAVLAGVANAAAPTRTESNVVPLRMNLAGDAAITLDGEAVVLGAGSATIGALTANQSVNVAQVAGTTTSVNAGTVDAGTQRVVLPSDQAKIPVHGDVAHDGVDAGNPVKVGLKTIAHGANPTAVAAADRTDWYANRAGIPFMIGGHPNVQLVSNNYTGAQTDVALVTVGAGTKIVVTKVSIYCANANTVAVNAQIGFGATTLTTGLTRHPGIAAGSGIVEGDGSGMLGIGADNEDLRFTCGAPTTGSIQVNVSFYTIES